jgi:hypothetical protein
MTKFTRVLLIVVVSLLVICYVGSYLWISRRGYADAEQFGFAGFYYTLPEPNDRWRRGHSVLVIFYHPLNAIDQWCGTGRAIGGEPMWGLPASRPIAE